MACAFGGNTRVQPCDDCDARPTDGSPSADSPTPLDGDPLDGPAAGDDAIAIDSPPPDARPIDARPCTGGDINLLDPATGHCYSIFNGALQWQQASDFCTARLSHLVTLSSSTENDLVRPTSSFRWLGLEDIGSEGSFTWVTGEPLIYTNWNGGEPNGGGGENCGGMLSNGRWNDFQCSDAWPFVCEFP
jgi:hypothetical protein